MKEHLKKIFLPMLLTASMVVLFLSAGNNMAQAKNNTIRYNNNVFTKKLYRNTNKITFRYTAAKDKKTIKKVYALLAKMKLQVVQPDIDEPKKVGTVSVVIQTKNKGKKKFVFQGDELFVGSKTYTIIQNNPLDGLRKIYQSIRK